MGRALDPTRVDPSPWSSMSYELRWTTTKLADQCTGRQGAVGAVDGHPGGVGRQRRLGAASRMVLREELLPEVRPEHPKRGFNDLRERAM